jgi:hypothetical protein
VLDSGRGPIFDERAKLLLKRGDDDNFRQGFRLRIGEFGFAL